MSKNFLHVGLDMDGVIVNFMEPICKYLGISESEITCYRLEEMWPDRSQEIRKFYGQEGYFRNLKPYPGAIECINELMKEDDIKLWLVSKPSKYSPITWSDKIYWIEDNLPQLINTTILCQDKSRIYLDAFVDDDPKNLEHTKFGWTVLFSRSWNKDCRKFLNTENRHHENEKKFIDAIIGNYDDMYEIIHRYLENYRGHIEF